MSKTIRLLLLFSLLFSGCRAAPTTTDKSLILKPCTVTGIDAECGALHVPEDRLHPNGRSLDLDIVVVRARQADRFMQVVCTKTQPRI